MTDNLHQLAAQMTALFSQAIAQANAEVDDIVLNNDRDTRRIERQRDRMLASACHRLGSSHWARQSADTVRTNPAASS